MQKILLVRWLPSEFLHSVLVMQMDTVGINIKANTGAGFQTAAGWPLVGASMAGNAALIELCSIRPAVVRNGGPAANSMALPLLINILLGMILAISATSSTIAENWYHRSAPLWITCARQELAGKDQCWTWMTEG